jgi:putative Mg2+ transporter-C (MgtC) family protein
MYFVVNSLYNNYTYECQIIIATLMGAIIGIERELRGKSAGIRTFSIICMASCLLSIISLHAPGLHDSMRLTAQIVSGIGFVGAGIIWHKEGGITEGLTTAASLWATSSFGIAIGYGFISLALTSAITILVIMEIFGYGMGLLKKMLK